MEAMWAAVADYVKELALSGIGGQAGLDNMKNIWEGSNSPGAEINPEQGAQPPNSGAPALPGPPAPSPWASLLSDMSKPDLSAPLPSPAPLSMQYPRGGSLGMPNSEMRAPSQLLNGQQLAAQAYGRYY